METHSISLGYETITDVDLDWTKVRANLNKIKVSTVYLSAGRAEWVTFSPWAAHPESVADSSRDSLGLATAAVRPKRRVVQMIDCFIPEWIKADPSVAGVQVSGKKNTYTPSASALLGVVGDRYLEVAVELTRRYGPDMVTFTELPLDATFGADDFALYKQMTGETAWPKADDGSIWSGSPKIGAWRSDVMAKFLRKVSNAMAAVNPDVELGMDVSLDWATPSRGRPDVGHDYVKLAAVVDRLIVWAYFAINGKTIGDVKRVTGALPLSGVPASKITVSIGMWSGADESATISAKLLASAVVAAENGGVNITPYSRMTDAHFTSVDAVW